MSGSANSKSPHAGNPDIIPIPNPLRSGDYTLSNASYSGDVGSTDPDNQPVLTLEHNAVADVSVAGFGDPIPQRSFTHYATFDVKGKDTLNLLVGGGRSPFAPGVATINLEPGARLTGSVSTDVDGVLTVNGGPGTRLVDYSGNLISGQVIIHPALEGAGTIIVSGGGNIGGALLELGGPVSEGETIKVDLGNLILDKPMQFLGTIDWAPITPPTTVTLAGVTADSYSLTNGELHLFRGNNDILNLKLTEQPGGPAPLVFQASQGIILSDYITPSGAVELPLHIGGSAATMG